MDMTACEALAYIFPGSGHCYAHAGALKSGCLAASPLCAHISWHAHRFAIVWLVPCLQLATNGNKLPHSALTYAFMASQYADMTQKYVLKDGGIAVNFVAPHRDYDKKLRYFDCIRGSLTFLRILNSVRNKPSDAFVLVSPGHTCTSLFVRHIHAMCSCPCIGHVCMCLFLGICI